MIQESTIHNSLLSDEVITKDQEKEGVVTGKGKGGKPMQQIKAWEATHPKQRGEDVLGNAKLFLNPKLS